MENNESVKNDNSIDQELIETDDHVSVDIDQDEKSSMMGVDMNSIDNSDESGDDDILTVPQIVRNASKLIKKQNSVLRRDTTIKKNDITMQINNYDPKKYISIKSFADTRPMRSYEEMRSISTASTDKHYFNKSEYFNKEANGIAVVIPFFNEPSHELETTLLSLYKTWNFLKKASSKWHKSILYVLLVQDGWSKADPSMKEYIKTMFPKKYTTQNNEKKYWWDYFEDFNTNKEDLPDKTYIFQKKNYGPVLINPQDHFVNEKKFMRISLVIKIKNRRKHNSHEWFIGKNGFAEAVNANYLFFTDAFNIYNKTLLYHLVTSLDENKSMVAITGRQRLMSKCQQGSNESMISIETLLRMVQLYDFESSNIIYNGAFSLGGLLPVIPGPCGLYRSFNLLDDDVRGFYFNTINEDPDKSGLVTGNLKIAEDRILSYAAVIKSKVEDAYMEFNQLAIFYFEAETHLDSFIFQRRRWINGSVAGYLYLLFFHFSHFKQWKTNMIRKFYIWILLMCQFLTYMLITIAPGISIKILYYGIDYFLRYYNVSLNFNYVIIGVVCWSIYIAHVFVHNVVKFNYIIMYLLLLFSFLTSIVSIASLFHYAFIDMKYTLLEVLIDGGYFLYFALYVFFGPFFVSLLLSGKGHSLLFMLKSFASYFVFLPMLIAWFGSYAYARLYDLSWGNRPSNEMDSISNSNREKIMKNFKNKNRIFIIIMIILNIIVFFVPLEGELIIISIFFVLASYQLTLSIIYCLLKITYKLSFICLKIKLRTSNTSDKSDNI